MLGLGAGLTAEITGGGMLAKIEDVEMGIAGPSLGAMAGLKGLLALAG